MRKVEGVSLAKFQKEMLDLVYSPVDRSAEYEPKTGIYRGMTRALYSEIIEGVYEKTYEYFKRNKTLHLWDQAFEKYLSECPPRHISFDLTVPEFIPYIPGAEWLRELADYEFTLGLAWDALERKSFLNSTLQLRVYESDVADWLERVEESPDLPESWEPPKNEMITLAIYRDLDLNEVKTLKVQPAVLDLLSQWQKGGAPIQSAQRIAELSGQSLQEVLKNLAPVLEMLHQEKILLPMGSA